jgi:hypothetical protein
MRNGPIGRKIQLAIKQPNIATKPVNLLGTHRPQLLHITFKQQPVYLPRHSQITSANVPKQQYRSQQLQTQSEEIEV